MTTPLNVLADTIGTVDSTEQTQTEITNMVADAESMKTETTETVAFIGHEKSTESTSQMTPAENEGKQVATDNSATLKRTQTDQIQQSESIQSAEQQTRAPSVSASSQDYGLDFIVDANLYDSNGKVVKETTGNSNNSAKWDFNIPSGSNVKTGDTMTVDVPEIFIIQKSTTFDLFDSGNHVIGKASVDKDTKKIIITFTNYVEENNRTNITGSFSVFVLWDTSKIKNGANNTIDWGFKETSVYFKEVGPDTRLLTKSGRLSPDDDTLVKWTVTLNNGGLDITNAILEDFIGNSQTFMPETLSIIFFKSDGTVDRYESVNKTTADITYDNSSFKINFGNINNKIFIYYSTRATDGGASNFYSNSIQFTGDNIQQQALEAFTPETGAAGTGYTLTDLVVKKVWNDSDDQDGKRPENVEIQLYKDGEEEGSPVALESNNSWTTSFNNLDINAKYMAKEINVPDGYTENYNITIDSAGVGVTTITNSHTPEVTTIKGTKVWDDKNNQDDKRPESITVNLLGNGQVVESKEVTAINSWTYEFTDIPQYKDGEEIRYTVTEDEVSGYTTIIDGTTIINSYTPEKTSVTVTKAWEDGNNQDGLRPESIQVQLYADRIVVGEPMTLTESTDWTYTWTDLDQKASGEDVMYTVKEMTEVKGYTSVVDDTNKGNIIITNSHSPEVTTIKGTKVWDDKNNQDGKRPESITVNLLANGQVVESKEVTETDGWAYEFTDVPQYQDGEAIRYTVTEDEVSDYTTTIDGTTITNSYTPKKTSVTVTKAWDDGNNQDGLRPESIQVQLYADGEEIGEPISLTESMDWTYTWTDLDQKVSGEDIMYTVKEITKVKGYTTVINDSNKGNIIITNNHTPKPTDSGSDSKNSNSENLKIKHSNKSSVLPKTGEKTSLIPVLLGILLLGIVVFAIVKRKKSEH
ncbi:Cna B-type domain-containing protein [Vagococcus elongatus]